MPSAFGSVDIDNVSQVELLIGTKVNAGDDIKANAKATHTADATAYGKAYAGIAVVHADSFVDVDYETKGGHRRARRN